MREQIWLRWCYGNLSLISNPKWAKLKINNDRNVFTFDWIRWVCACFECKRGAILFSIILFFFIIHVVLFSISFCALSCAELKIILCGFSAPRHWRLAERSKIKTIRKKRINATKRKPPRWDAIWRRRRVICRWNWLTASTQSTHTVPHTHTHEADLGFRFFRSVFVKLAMEHTEEMLNWWFYLFVHFFPSTFRKHCVVTHIEAAISTVANLHFQLNGQTNQYPHNSDCRHEMKHGEHTRARKSVRNYSCHANRSRPVSEAIQNDWPIDNRMPPHSFSHRIESSQQINGHNFRLRVRAVLYSSEKAINNSVLWRLGSAQPLK